MLIAKSAIVSKEPMKRNNAAGEASCIQEAPCVAERQPRRLLPSAFGLLIVKIRKLFWSYRPGQPNWEYTMWKCKDFAASQILRENNFGLFEASKPAF